MKPSANSRAFVSLLTAGLFVLVAGTGLVLFAMPAGRVAYWTGWRFFCLDKTRWDSLHLVSSVLFVAAGIWHVTRNWKPLLSYLYTRAVRWRMPRRELLGAVAVLVAIIGGTLNGLPPFRQIIDLSGQLRNSWAVNHQIEPPFGGAEELTLAVLAERTGLSAAAMTKALAGAGVTVGDGAPTVHAIADRNGIAPARVWEIIRVGTTAASAKSAEAVTAWTPAGVDARFAGQGIGRMSLIQIAEVGGVDFAVAQERLRSAGLSATGGDKVRQTADRFNVHPMDVVKIMLIDKYVPRQE